jgi:hypothetical protein
VNYGRARLPPSSAKQAPQNFALPSLNHNAPGQSAAKPPIARGFSFPANQQLSAGAAADRRVVEADVAAATAFAALREAIAASLQHRTAGLVAAGAADAATVFRVFTLALATAEVHLAALNAVPGAAAAAHTVAQHAAEILQRAAGDFVIAAAMNLAAGLRLFEFDRAAGQNTPVRAGRRALWERTRLNALDRARERRDR